MRIGRYLDKTRLIQNGHRTTHARHSIRVGRRKRRSNRDGRSIGNSRRLRSIRHSLRRVGLGRNIRNIRDGLRSTQPGRNLRRRVVAEDRASSSRSSRSLWDWSSSAQWAW